MFLVLRCYILQILEDTSLRYHLYSIGGVAYHEKGWWGMGKQAGDEFVCCLVVL